MFNKIIKLDTVSSTNSYIKELAKNNIDDGTVVIAKHQSQGRGTHNRSFESPLGGLYLSYLKYIDTSPEMTSDITQWTAVSIVDALYKFCGIKCDIKFINDIIFNNKKLCGILTELSQNRLVIGIGINVNTELSLYSESISDSITSIKLITGKEYSIDKLSECIIESLNNQFNDWPNNDWRKIEYERRLLSR